MKRTIVGVSSLAAVLAAVLAACSPAAWDTEVPGAADLTSDGGSCDPGAPKKLEAMDPAGLAACCAAGATGQAHCVPTDKTPSGYRKSMAACGGGSCIPDALLKSGGAKPKDCESSRGKGVCLSVCVPSVAAKKELLEKGPCTGEDELCVPCISPLDQKPTGACDIGSGKTEDCTGSADGGASGDGGSGLQCPFTGTPIVFTSFPVCAPGARCVPEVGVPEKQRGMLKKCDTGLCVPEPIIATRGSYSAPTCNSIAGAEGRCLSTAIPIVADQAERLPQDTCGATERCVPCVNPISGETTPACTIGCDTGPKKPPVVLANCCDGLAKCVPSSTIAASLRSSLNAQGCASAELCVPKDITNKTPTTCKASLLAAGLLGDRRGVCLSRCLEFGVLGKLVIDQEDCPDADHVCAPCSQNGKPTGAPGCN